MNGRIQKEKYLKAFLIGFGLMALCYIPFLLIDNGMFIYYGDYNAQQIPFYQLVHDAVRSGNIFWNWQTDLGTNMIGSYSFYLLGSPFFWLTVPFPSSWVPYMMPFLMCLKYGFATLTSYAYIRRFVKSTDVALVGAIMYAFSGFSAYNIFFNHFHDVICFFPLILIGLEEAVVNNRKGCFALAVALMATINYYFFAGQVIFLIIYFILRMIMSKEFKLTFSKFLSLAFESIIGVGIAAVILVPSIMMVMQNPRVGGDRVLLGWHMVYYRYAFDYLTIIQSMFFVPDIPARPNFFPLITDKWSSVAIYLPLFSMAGVIAFFAKFKKHWIKALLLICGFCAFVPFLNSMFQLFNGTYYARWFYMPILIMALATAILIDKHGLDLKFGIAVTAFMTLVFSAIGLLPSYNKNTDEGAGESGRIVFGELPKYGWKFWLTVAFSFGAILMLVLLYRMRKTKKIMRYVTVMTCVTAVTGTMMMMTFGREAGPKTSTIIEDNINQNFELEDEENQFYRVDTYKGLDNSNMYWGYSGLQCFHSIVPGSVFSLYNSMGIDRSVGSRPDYSYYGLRGLTSVKYLIRPKDSDIEYDGMPGFVYTGDQGRFEVYKNEYYVPMGFTYEYYFDSEQLESVDDEKVDKLYTMGVYLSDEQIEKYSPYIDKLPKTRNYQLIEDNYLMACEKLADNSCSYFKYDNQGFTAKANVKSANFMVFSVPYEKGWTATVNGKSVDIENVQNGFMAVLVPRGDVEIRFDYHTPGLVTGLIVTSSCIVLLILYLVLWKILKKVKPDKFGTKKYAHLNLFETVSEVSLKNEYALKEASREFCDDEPQEKAQSADFLHKKPKAVNVFKRKKDKKTEASVISEAPQEIKPQEEEMLSEETRQALENLSGKNDGENSNNAS